MILSFKAQFRKPILTGKKIHTIREDSKRRWKAGRIAHMATGVRTRNYNMFLLRNIVSVQDIFMTYDYDLQVSIGGRELIPQELKILAANDGFETYEAFVDWFYPIIKANPDDCFSGRIIHWTNHRY